ncbi:MAG: XdhC/CoxI family protein [Pseudoflavonifractor sp.]
MERLIICGGGHVSLALAQIAELLEFEIYIIDDRTEFANLQRFPKVKKVFCLPFMEALDKLGSRPDDFYVILTRGHVFDKDCLAHVLQGEYGYVGMIGSHIKIAAVMAALKAQGFEQDRLDGVHTPIGIKIGGQTPAEVAVSIAAELVDERAKLAPALPPAPEQEPGVLCTITRKSGSAPRGEGAWMLVHPDGTFCGTIGGGAVEYQAQQDALAMWSGKLASEQRTYDLSHAAADLGMVCGGKIDVKFEIRR